MEPVFILSAAVALVAYSFAIQQMVDFADLLIFRTEEAQLSRWRRLILKIMTLSLGLVGAAACKQFAWITGGLQQEWLRILVIGFGLAAGAEAANSFLKLARYSKRRRKAEALRAESLV